MVAPGHGWRQPPDGGCRHLLDAPEGSSDVENRLAAGKSALEGSVAARYCRSDRVAGLRTRECRLRRWRGFAKIEDGATADDPGPFAEGSVFAWCAICGCAG